MPIKATVIADTVNPDGDRLTTMAVTMPRFILAEFNTHRAFSRNSASSRAIPFVKMVQQVMEDPYIPDRFGKYNTGMQPDGYLEGYAAKDAQQYWLNARDRAVAAALELAYLDDEQLSAVRGYHFGGVYTTDLWPTPDVAKEIVNRILEPWMLTTVVVSSTEWDNFFTLRCNPDAQADIRRVAVAMRYALQESTPRYAKWGQWHMPYMDTSDGEVSQDILFLSASACARVSYLREGTPMDVERARELAKAKHLSPFEHVAQAERGQHANFEGFLQLRHLL